MDGQNKFGEEISDKVKYLRMDRLQLVEFYMVRFDEISHDFHLASKWWLLGEISITTRVFNNTF